MLSLPVKSRRKKQPYLAIRSRLFSKQIAKQAQLYLPEIRKFMADQEIVDIGPSFFRYNMISASGEMDIEFGLFTDRLHSGSGPIRAGILPGGSFYSVTWTGHYEKLSDVNAMFMGWGRVRDINWDNVVTEEGVFYGCRIDIFHRSMHIEPDPDKWVTEVAAMIRPSSGEN